VKLYCSYKYPGRWSLPTISDVDSGPASLVQRVFRLVSQSLVFLFLATSASYLCSQTVAIKLVNGRSGRPMADSHVSVWIGNDRKAAIVIPTDKYGIALRRGCRNCVGTAAIYPVVKYDDSLRVNVPFVLCESGGSNYSWLAIRRLSTRKLIKDGIVMLNTCGKATASPTPGELIIFVRPLNFREMLKE